MMKEFKLTRTKFVSCMELLDPESGISEENMSEAEYVSLLPDVRARFLAHDVPGYDVEEELKADVGTLATYLGYVKFLEAELEGQASIMIDPDTGKNLSKMGQKKARKRISKVMLVSGAVGFFLCFNSTLADGLERRNSRTLSARGIPKQSELVATHTATQVRNMHLTCYLVRPELRRQYVLPIYHMPNTHFFLPSGTT